MDLKNLIEEIVMELLDEKWSKSERTKRKKFQFRRSGTN